MIYKLLQLTNSAFGAVATDANMPLGIPTRSVSCDGGCTPTFVVSSSGADTVTLNKTGVYKILYTASVVAAAAGVVTINLVDEDGTVLATASETATAIGDTVNVSIAYAVRVVGNCCGLLTAKSIRFVNAGVALTSGTSNLILEKVA